MQTNYSAFRCSLCTDGELVSRTKLALITCQKTLPTTLKSTASSTHFILKTIPEIMQEQIKKKCFGLFKFRRHA